jgi:hypothetical protein
MTPSRSPFLRAIRQHGIREWDDRCLSARHYIAPTSDLHVWDSKIAGQNQTIVLLKTDDATFLSSRPNDARERALQRLASGCSTANPIRNSNHWSNPRSAFISPRTVYGVTA